MEPSSAPEKPQAEPAFFSGSRSPNQELALGISVFLLVFGIFFTIQLVVFLREAIARMPELEGQSVNLALIQEPAFQQEFEKFAYNGDVIAQAALWSGLGALVLLLLCAWLWKRADMRQLLGLKVPRAIEALKWTGIFILLIAAMEALAWLSPAFRTDFMTRVVGSTTDLLPLLLGAGLMAPLFEEFLLRGLGYGTLRHVMDKHAAVAITAGLFTLMHLQYEWTVMLLILPLGVVLGYARANTGSIWVPVALHTLNNVVSVLVPSWY